MDNITSGKLAEKAGVNVETLRFYEKNGILKQPKRSESGYRLYSNHDLSKLHFITRAKELGFSLKEIKELIALEEDKNATCSNIKTKADLKVLDIQEKIKSLKKIEKALKNVMDQCQLDMPISECAILDCLKTGVKCD